VRKTPQLRVEPVPSREESSYESIWALLLALVASACGGRTALAVARRVEIDAATSEQGHSTSSVPIYLLDATGTLLRFDPPAAAFATIGPVDCGTQSSASPTSTAIGGLSGNGFRVYQDPDGGILYHGSMTAMAVDRSGTAYLAVQAADGDHVYHVSTVTAACEPTGMILPAPAQILPNAMAFVADRNALGETLYALVLRPPTGLLNFASFDPSTFLVRRIGLVGGCGLEGAYLMGTGAGDLFCGADSPGDAIQRLDTTSGETNLIWIFPLGSHTTTAAAAWGGEFYIFVSDGGPYDSAVFRFRPRDGSLTQVAKWPSMIVLAAVQTTAPIQ
jgi:hypothetical protein